MRSGTLRHKVRIETPVQVKQLNGSMKTTWELYLERWAKIETLRGNERQTATASWPKSDRKITIRYANGILPTMRIVYNDKIYSILNVNDLEERHREIEFITESGVKAQ